jgi:hypothetical protein
MFLGFVAELNLLELMSKVFTHLTNHKRMVSTYDLEML